LNGSNAELSEQIIDVGLIQALAGEGVFRPCRLILQAAELLKRFLDAGFDGL
jgi:hypothetical protein